MKIADLDGRDAVRGLIRISERLNADTPLGPRLEDLCRETTELLECDRSSIMLWDGERFRAKYNHGNPPDIAENFHLYRAKADTPLMAEMLTERSYVVVNDAASAGGLGRVAHAARIVSIVVAPMFCPNESPLGFMTAEFNERIGHFDETRGELVLGAARLAQGAILTHNERQEKLRSLESRRQLLEELVSAEDQERRRISREIHDDSLQRMLALGLKLSALTGGVSDTEALASLRSLEKECKAACDSLRWMLQDIHPPSLESSGLTEAIESVLARSASRAGWQFIIEDQLKVQPGPAMETIIYRIAQQAISNIESHAQASTVSVVLETLDRGTTVRITDDGVGLDLDSVPADRFGLVSMRERAEHAGGYWSARSGKGDGTVIEAWIPHSI